MKMRPSRFFCLPGTGLVLSGLLFSNQLRGAPPLPIDNCANIPRGAIPQPNGFYVRSWERIQTMGAQADYYVIYLNEWSMGGPCLTPYGQYHLGEIAEKLSQVPFSVILEPEANASINETRRQAILVFLSQHGITDAQARVQFGFSKSEGLYGEDALQVYRQLYGGSTLGGTGSNGVGSISSSRGGFPGSLSGGFRGY